MSAGRRSFCTLTVVVLAAGTALLAGCAGTPGDGSTSPSEGPTTATGTLTVFAAASLRDTFTELGQEFEGSHPGVDVVFSFGGSSDLVTQLTGGAPGDVFASADQANMDKVADAGLLLGEAIPFASNTLSIVVPPGNPGQVTSFADLATPGLAVVVCAPQVPCGRATQRLEDATGVTLSPVSEDSSVTDVLNKVVTGEADAGLVYVTDASGAGDGVETVSVPEVADIVNVYPIAALAEAPQPRLAEEFVDLVTGPQGQQVLADAGFAPAP
jgi:molybdate transport system substrate-binding protein